MAAPTGNQNAKNNKGGAGNPGYGKLKFIRDKVSQFSETYWKEWERMMNGNDKDEKKFAMAEFNKLQVKMIPQSLDGGEDDDGNTKPLEIRIVKPDDN